ncbi:MAG: RNA polymerase sigma factor [Acidobacteriia bacterium]|nr:RNA polymerase sigma factor [Terriglobia bacterium]
MGEKTSPEEIEAVRLAVLEAYRVNADELSRMALVMTRNKALAQDILQETFLRYFLTRMHGDEIADERDWLRRVLRNLIQDWKESSRAEDSVALEEAESTEAQTRENIEPGERALNWAMKAARMLAPREQECIKLRAQGLAYTEIASAMQISVGTVGALLNRAIQKIKQTAPLRERTE